MVLFMEPIKYFIECLLPITACDIKCHYCYVVQRDNRKMKMASLKHSPEFMAQALSRKRLGGVAYISICGAGETMMQKELPQLVYCLLKDGHYVNITTNGTVTKAFRKIAEITPPELLHRLMFSFSYHYIELKRLGWIGRFYENVKYVKSLGCSFVVQLNLCDEYEPYFDEIKKTCLDNVGALPQLAATRREVNLKNHVEFFTERTPQQYLEKGEEFDSPLFRFTMKNFMTKRNEFCYAGKWAFNFNFETGILSPCYTQNVKQNLYKNLEEPIRFTCVGKHCNSPFCMNSSHFMAMGVIPSVECPTYEQLRNRTCVDGGEWYNATMKEVLSHKLYEFHSLEYNKYDVWKQHMEDVFLGTAMAMIPPSLKEKIKRKIRK